jgi:hypothetical protein
MAVTTYAGWVADGRPWDPAFPVEDLAACLRGYGYTVYILGNNDHATAQPPEDHMPYSHTPWPGRQPYHYVLACDIMPPPAGKGLPSLAQLGAQLYKDKQAGVAGALWLKYMNWEPSGGGGPCYHDSWEPAHARTSSTDRGHIHISGRTDFVTSHAAAGYDPIARIRGDDMPLSTDDLKKIADAVWNRDGIPAVQPPYADPDIATNPTWQADNTLSEAVRQGRENAAAIAALATKVDQILAALAGGPTLPPPGNNTSATFTGTVEFKPVTPTP